MTNNKTVIKWLDEMKDLLTPDKVVWIDGSDEQTEELRKIAVETKEMRNNNWETDVNENSSYEEIEEAYDEMLEEYDAAEDAMYPNGRDYDAEDFD